jgi:hypothetical protein
MEAFGASTFVTNCATRNRANIPSMERFRPCLKGSGGQECVLKGLEFGLDANMFDRDERVTRLLTAAPSKLPPSNPRDNQQELTVDRRVPLWHHPAIMSGTRHSFSVIRDLSSKWRRVKAKFLSVISLAIALGAPDFGLAQTGPPRQPVGIYARFVVHGSDEQVTNSITAIISNSAISGILSVFNWSDLSPTNSPTNSLVGNYDWRLLDDLANAVGYFNLTNPGQPPKTIQLEITPGFNSPPWFFSNTCSCDPMFLTNSQGSIVNTIVNTNGQTNLVLVGVTTTNGVTTNCAWASFLQSENFGNPTVGPLPLPWNAFYTNAWATFIQAVAARYESNPFLVSVTVAGPTASSAEMILPNESNDATNYLKWNPIIALDFPGHPEYTNSDALFIKAWEDAIDLYGAAFSNLTLVVTTGNGLPNFLDANGDPYTNNYSVPPGFWPDCASTGAAGQSNIMDCAAETTILAYFADARHGGNNAKAAQGDGMSAHGIHSHPLGGGDLGDHGIKWLAQNTAGGNAPLPGTSNIVSRVLGGSQVGGDMGMAVITQHPDTEGCPMLNGGCSNISPQQAIYNVLTTFFDGTPLGSNYGAPPIVSSNFPLNYLQIYWEDVIYANTNSIVSLVTNDNGFMTNMTAEMLFSNASLQISQIAELDLALNVQTVGSNVQLTWLATTPAAYQLQVNHNLSKPNGWKPASQTPNFVGDYYQVTIPPNAAASFFRLSLPGP